jgi:hypothetical protein
MTTYDAAAAGFDLCYVLATWTMTADFGLSKKSYHC